MMGKSVTIRRVEAGETSCKGCAFDDDEYGCQSMCNHLADTLGIGTCNNDDGWHIYVVEVENG